LAAYERGEYKTVLDAARAAGIKVGQTPLQILRRAWNRASSEERAMFKTEKEEWSGLPRFECSCGQEIWAESKTKVDCPRCLGPFRLAPGQVIGLTPK
jgi:hypothetical protein